jgi:uncharacterized protein YcbK (DUF882 family)
MTDPEVVSFGLDDKHFTLNFSKSEVKCKCGKCTGLPTSPEGLDKFMWALRNLQSIRDQYGKPMRLSSGYRCPDHNTSVSSTGRNGPHTQGAFDVLVYGREARDLLVAAMNSRAIPTGIGISQKGPHGSRFIHFDWLGSVARPNVWSY